MAFAVTKELRLPLGIAAGVEAEEGVDVDVEAGDLTCFFFFAASLGVGAVLTLTLEGVASGVSPLPADKGLCGTVSSFGSSWPLGPFFLCSSE